MYVCVCVCVCVYVWGVTRLQPSIGATGDEFPNCLLLSTLDPGWANNSQSNLLKASVTETTQRW